MERPSVLALPNAQLEQARAVARVQLLCAAAQARLSEGNALGALVVMATHAQPLLDAAEEHLRFILRIELAALLMGVVIAVFVELFVDGAELEVLVLALNGTLRDGRAQREERRDDQDGKRELHGAPFG